MRSGVLFVSEDQAQALDNVRYRPSVEKGKRQVDSELVLCSSSAAKARGLLICSSPLRQFIHQKLTTVKSSAKVLAIRAAATMVVNLKGL